MSEEEGAKHRRAVDGMKSLDLRAREEREREACRRALALFDHLAAAELEAARALVAERFRWFEHPIDLRAYRGGALIASNPRVVPRPLSARMSDAMLDGPISDDGVLVLIDVARDQETVTCAVVVSGAELAIDRVFDPSAIRQYLGALGGED